MNISASDRACLLGSQSYSVQIQRILSQRQDATMAVGELRCYYMDLSEGRFQSTLATMKAHGILSLQGDDVTLLRTTAASGAMADRIWRAVKMCRTFTVSQIVEICPDILPATIQRMLTGWSRVGAVNVKVEARDPKQTVWEVSSTRRMRPKLKVTPRASPKEDNSPRGIATRMLWQTLESYGDRPFTAADLLGDLDVDIAQWRFVQHMVTSWQKMGLIQICQSGEGEETTYRVDVELLKEVQ